MKHGLAFVIVAALFGTSAFAQQQTPQQNVAQMLGGQLGICFSNNATLTETLQKAQADLAAAQTRVKELETKLSKTEDKK